ncbi:hypothetical protein [Nocardia neocaledoniensis]|uniref:hypothetical protein n=1 Tax=Nocardia neocaledoniensis TaxID=236511 RepID=UPI002455ED64|nr:hypothetical protein [Nocardia neocaledoniensis]
MALALLASAGPVAAVPPPPPNPSDGEIAGADAQVDARVGEIGAGGKPRRAARPPPGRE